MKIQQTLDEFTAYVEKTYTDKYADANAAIEPARVIMSGELGKGFNIGNALKYISRYSTKGYDKSGQRDDLFKAAHYLLFEAERLAQETENAKRQIDGNASAVGS